jgi:hypothetical protein
MALRVAEENSQRAAAVCVVVCLTLSIAVGCAGAVRSADPVGEGGSGLREGEWGRTIQLMHRKARSPSGRLFEAAVEEASDLAARIVLGERLPFDAWQRLVPSEGPPTVLAHPRRGPVAEAVAGRLDMLAGPGGSVEVRETAAVETVPRGRLAVVVWQPVWREGALEPALPAGVEADLVLVDLFDTRVGGQPWSADVLIAAPSTAEAAVVARRVLQSRATGRVADAARLAAEAGLILEDEGWVRLALAD